MTNQPSETIDSPCVRNCCLNEEDVCLGCGRSLQEIIRWSNSSNVDKRSILIVAAERRQIIRNTKNQVFNRG